MKLFRRMGKYLVPFGTLDMNRPEGTRYFPILLNDFMDLAFRVGDFNVNGRYIFMDVAVVLIENLNTLWDKTVFSDFISPGHS